MSKNVKDSDFLSVNNDPKVETLSYASSSLNRAASRNHQISRDMLLRESTNAQSHHMLPSGEDGAITAQNPNSKKANHDAAGKKAKKN